MGVACETNSLRCKLATLRWCHCKREHVLVDQHTGVLSQRGGPFRQQGCTCVEEWDIGLWPRPVRLVRHIHYRTLRNKQASIYRTLPQPHRNTLISLSSKFRTPCDSATAANIQATPHKSEPRSRASFSRMRKADYSASGFSIIYATQHVQFFIYSH